jgi:hypothetical protein
LARPATPGRASPGPHATRLGRARAGPKMRASCPAIVPQAAWTFIASCWHTMQVLNTGGIAVCNSHVHNSAKKERKRGRPQTDGYKYRYSIDLLARQVLVMAKVFNANARDRDVCTSSRTLTTQNEGQRPPLRCLNFPQGHSASLPMGSRHVHPSKNGTPPFSAHLHVRTRVRVAVTRARARLRRLRLRATVVDAALSCSD